MTSLTVAFEHLRSALEQAGVRYAIGGSWASTAHGEARFTNDVDILADFTPTQLQEFVRNLSDEFYLDEEEAFKALQIGRPFNVLYMPTVFKFDFFPAAAYPLGSQELERAIPLARTGLSASAVPFVTPEDILLAKLHWYRLGGEVSEIQWRDMQGILRACGGALDRPYLEQSAATLGVSDLLIRLSSTSE